MKPTDAMTKPLRTLAEAQRDIEQQRAREALARIKVNGVPLTPAAYPFVPVRTAINSAPPAAWWRLPEWPMSLPRGNRRMRFFYGAAVACWFTVCLVIVGFALVALVSGG